MIINDVEIEDLDLCDADIADKYENAIDKLKVLKDDKGNYVGMPLGDIIRKQCNVIFEFFNTMWGEGTDKKVFGNKTNIRICTEAIEKVTEEMEKQLDQINIVKSKYSPNRAERKVYNNSKHNNRRF